MKKIYVFFALLFMCSHTYIMAQVPGEIKRAEDGTRTVSGTLVNNEGEPLVGATVVVTGTTTGTVTDLDGNYSLEVPADTKSITISSVGFQTTEVELGAENVINLTMKEGLELQEMVVTALGISREKRALGYAVQEVKGEAVAQSGQTNTVTALQGRISGVQINQSDGTPGAGSSIKVRGSNSVGWGANNQPLFVIDGVPIDNGFQESGDPANLQNNLLNGVSTSNRAIDINPDDIETMSVLKGAAAAALYGLRALNGVVLITTKAGTRKSGVRVNVSSDIAFEEVSRIPDVQQTYGQGSAGAYNNQSSLSWGPRVSEMGEVENVLGELVTPQIYDNISPFFETGVAINNAINVSGGSDVADFYVSFSNHNHDGVIPTSTFGRRTAKVSGSIDVFKDLTIGAALNYANSGGNRIQKGSNLSNPLFTVYPAPITYDLHGLPFEDANNEFLQVHYRSRFDNPHWSNKHNSFVDNVDRLFGNINFNYKPLDWLSVRYTIGTDLFVDKRKEVLSLGAGETDGRTAEPSGGSIAERRIFSREINSDLIVTADRQIGDDLRATVRVGNNVNAQTSTDVYTKGIGISIGGFDNISNTSTPLIYESTSEKRIIGLWADAQFDFKRMIYLGLSARNDWSSTLPGKSFFYPGVNLGFVFTEPLGLTDSKILSFGKIRASWAQVGQDAPIYATQTTYAAPTPGSGFLGNNLAFPVSGINAFEFGNSAGNPDLDPQNETSWEIGADLKFFQNRVGLDVTYYDKVATNQILNASTPASTGITSYIINAGKITNKGLELTLNVTPIETRDLAWDLTFNYAANRGKVVELTDGVEFSPLGGFSSIGTRLVPGQAISVIWGTPYLRDDSGNIIIDDRPTIGGSPNPSYGMPVDSPEQGIVGITQADWIGGLGSRLTYKGLTFGLQFTTRQGGDRYSGNNRLMKLYGQAAVTEDRETPIVVSGVKGHLDANNELVSSGEANDIAITPGQQFWFSEMDAIDESSVYDASFIRLSEVSLAYDFGTLLRRNNFIKGMEVFLRANNLLLITDYPNFDPETNLGGANSNFEGFEYMNLPNTRRIGGGVRLSF